MSDTEFSYTGLVRYFGEDVIQNRYIYLHEKMSFFIADYGLEQYVYISETRLRHVVLDYFTDIYRLKVFHGINAVNRYKIIAFTVFWLLRRRPLQVKEWASNRDECAFVNEDFAVSLIMLACITPANSSDVMYESRVELDAESEVALSHFRDDLRYHLIYREYDARNLELMLNAYETGYNLGKRQVRKPTS